MRYENEALIVETGDLIRLQDEFWEINGIHLGTVNQQDLYDLRPLGMRENKEGITMIPRQMFEALCRSGAATGYSILKASDE